TRASLHGADTRRVVAHLRTWAAAKPWATHASRKKLHELRITAGAYAADTQECIERYLAALEVAPNSAQQVLRLALLCVLETVSFTRKDGQYLRWDHRSPRQRVRGAFDKGSIPSFDQAISAKVAEIIDDLEMVTSQSRETESVSLGRTNLLPGSCLD